MITRTTKDKLRELVDRLPETEMEAARRFLEFLIKEGDPVAQAFENAPVDEDEMSDDMIRELQESRPEAARRELIPWEEVKRELANE